MMVGLAFLISISVLSCQTNDDGDYSQQVAEVTAADLFITSEAHQNLEKEIRKSLRKNAKCHFQILERRNGTVSAT